MLNFYCNVLTFLCVPSSISFLYICFECYLIDYRSENRLSEDGIDEQVKDIEVVDTEEMVKLSDLSESSLQPNCLIMQIDRIESNR